MACVQMFNFLCDFVTLLIGKPRRARHQGADCKYDKHVTHIQRLLLTVTNVDDVFLTGSHGSRWDARSTRCKGEFTTLSKL